MGYTLAWSIVCSADLQDKRDSQETLYIHTKKKKYYKPDGIERKS